MDETIRLEDMRLFAVVGELGSFTAAGRRLGLPKQTVSRRIGELERALGAQLLQRSTRRLRPTEIGAAYLARCAEVARLADEANRAVADARTVPSGTLRITADPVFGEAFVAGLVTEYLGLCPEVRADVVLTRRRVDLVEEGFDVAFRVGRLEDARLTATRLGPARIRYCAAPAYLARRGAPSRPEDLAGHECLVVAAEGAPARWPFRGAAVPVTGRLRCDSQPMAHAAALEGLGIALFPEFACVADVRAGRLVPVLDDQVADVGAVWIA